MTEALIVDRRAYVESLLGAVPLEQHTRIHAAPDPLLEAGLVVLDALLPPGEPVRVIRQSGHGGRQWAVFEKVEG